MPSTGATPRFVDGLRRHCDQHTSDLRHKIDKAPHEYAMRSPSIPDGLANYAGIAAKDMYNHAGCTNSWLHP